MAYSWKMYHSLVQYKKKFYLKELGPSQEPKRQRTMVPDDIVHEMPLNDVFEVTITQICCEIHESIIFS